MDDRPALPRIHAHGTTGDVSSSENQTFTHGHFTGEIVTRKVAYYPGASRVFQAHANVAALEGPASHRVTSSAFSDC